MKLPAARIAAFLQRPDHAIRAVLLYGPDLGLVRERADILARTVCLDLKDPFRVADLSSAALAADQAQILAAGQGFVADANDVSGNNIPTGGGSYVGTSTTVAGATSVAGLARGSIPVGPAANEQTGLSSAGSGSAGHEPSGGGGAGGQDGNLGQPVMDHGHHWHW